MQLAGSQRTTYVDGSVELKHLDLGELYSF